MKRILIILAMLVTINTNAQWEPDVRLTNAPGGSYTNYNSAWCIAANGNVVHTVWSDGRDGNSEIYYKRSIDNGTNWGVDLRLTNNISESAYPSIAVSGTFVHVAWADKRDGNDKIYYKRSTDGGINWGVDTHLSTNDSLGSSIPSISVSGSNVHVVWEDRRNNNWEIYYKRSTDGGINWGADIRLTNDLSTSGLPSIAVAGSLVNVVWQDYRDVRPGIYYKRSTDGGINWGTDTRLTNNTFWAEYPSIAVSGSNVHIVWPDERDGYFAVYYLRSTDGGLNWGAYTRLTNNAYSWVPSIAVSGLFVHIAWQDERDGNEEIYYKRSTDGGINWGTDTRLTNNTAMSYYPSIAVAGSFVHVLWHDNRDSGNWEIYYKRNPTGNSVSINNISTETPSKYSLSQNYPNPFNPSTNIKFSIVNVGDVKLVVYDVQGREVRTLVNESLKPGTYEAAFDGSALNSGVYFYKLITDGFTETKKMILIK